MVVVLGELCGPVMGTQIRIRDQLESGQEGAIIRKWRHIHHNSSSWMAKSRQNSRSLPLLLFVLLPSPPRLVGWSMEILPVTLHTPGALGSLHVLGWWPQLIDILITAHGVFPFLQAIGRYLKA